MPQCNNYYYCLTFNCHHWVLTAWMCSTCYSSSNHQTVVWQLTFLQIFNAFLHHLFQVALNSSEPCTVQLQGVIRFDPTQKKLYYCNCIEWKVRTATHQFLWILTPPDKQTKNKKLMMFLCSAVHSYRWRWSTVTAIITAAGLHTYPHHLCAVINLSVSLLCFSSDSIT